MPPEACRALSPKPQLIRIFWSVSTPKPFHKVTTALKCNRGTTPGVVPIGVGCTFAFKHPPSSGPPLGYWSGLSNLKYIQPAI